MFLKTTCLFKGCKGKMLSLLIITLAVTSALGYDEKYDKIDVDAVLADDAHFTSYLECFLDKAPCTPEYSKDFREILPEVISTSCEKCTDSQKIRVRKIVKAIFERKPDMAEEFREKYDPKKEHEESFKAFIKQDDN